MILISGLGDEKSNPGLVDVGLISPGVVVSSLGGFDVTLLG